MGGVVGITQAVGYKLPSAVRCSCYHHLVIIMASRLPGSCSCSLGQFCTGLCALDKEKEHCGCPALQLSYSLCHMQAPLTL